MRAVLLALSFGDSYKANKNIIEKIKRNVQIYSDPYIITDKNIGVHLMDKIDTQNLYIIPGDECQTMLTALKAGLKKVRSLKKADLYLIIAFPVARRGYRIMHRLAPWLTIYPRFVGADYSRYDQQRRARHPVWSYLIEPFLCAIPWALYKRFG